MYDLRRYEMKFLISAEAKATILQAGGETLEIDSHVEQDNVYRVTSQYYDTVDLESFWEKIDGVDPRRKFRIRLYGTEFTEESVTFLEIKYRRGQTVFKERLRLAEGSAEYFLKSASPLEDLDSHCLAEKPAEKDILANFVAASAVARIPSNVISYLREPWVGKVDRRLRVTFDHVATALYPTKIEEAMAGEGLPLFPPNKILLEVKFSSRLPVWLRDILIAEGLSPIRFSKYATGVEKQTLQLKGAQR